MNYVNEFFLRAANGVKFQANDGAIVSPFQIYVNSQIVEWQDPATGSFQMSHVDNAKMILFPMEAIAKNIYVFGRTVCPLVEYAFQCHKKDFGELPVKPLTAGIQHRHPPAHGLKVDHAKGFRRGGHDALNFFNPY